MNVPASQRPAHLRFLVAEDDPDLRYIIVHVLTERWPAAEIAAYDNGRDALADFDEHGANFVVSNHDMPLMDGPTFVRHLRERLTDLPILMVSGSPEAHGEGMAAGISLFLDKDEIMARLTSSVGMLLAETGISVPGRE